MALLALMMVNHQLKMLQRNIFIGSELRTPTTTPPILHIPIPSNHRVLPLLFIHGPHSEFHSFPLLLIKTLNSYIKTIYVKTKNAMKWKKMISKLRANASFIVSNICTQWYFQVFICSFSEFILVLLYARMRLWVGHQLVLLCHISTLLYSNNIPWNSLLPHFQSGVIMEKGGVCIF